MTIPGTAVFKTHIGNAPYISGRVSALVRTAIWKRAGKFRIPHVLSRIAGMFSRDLKANARRLHSITLADHATMTWIGCLLWLTVLLQPFVPPEARNGVDRGL